ncbi:2-isopropylmalate synthase [Telmatospirillum siberiense]|uniref:2-isopropylmalate synthase n=1 Tax=Telmatospirillum siberiense TaxID=382514 RepID=A0A2N3PQT8_9PROT|nr:2-isopropylmalate synthase [Telmatospirillum siberiense]PKU22754.1 2-isopropylmalate synthase [Telmatospirillum siberiense]
MNKMPFDKYRAFTPISLPDRQWPNRAVTTAPIWCSVDLRDGNQALIEPMSPDAKRRMFELLLEMGFKEIEVGFPAASQTDFDFLRLLIDEKLIPDDVTIQVLTQSREHLIRRTFEAIKGARKAIVHLYNSTSELQRRVVFGADREAVTGIAVTGTKLIRDLADQMTGTEVVFQYSPESFTGTELDYAVEITEAVMAAWGPTPEKRMIVNLPATVEMATPNIYADQIEWFCRHIKDRRNIIVSIHPHNDRGTGVAAAELALMAGGERIEGTLFGNGERTGNVDVVTMAMNLMTQGVDPELRLSDINRIIEVSQECTQIPVHPRHPYAGSLVFTAFSGSHQDAIKKGLSALRQSGANFWEVPYLPVDPADLGRSYEAVIRINSQSGKGGIAYLLEQEFGLILPRALQVEFAQVVQRRADASGKELSAAEIWKHFEEEFLKADHPVSLISHKFEHHGENEDGVMTATVENGVSRHTVKGRGNGPIDAFIDGLKAIGIKVQLVDYHEHAVGRGANAKAVAYVEITGRDGTLSGVGMDEDIVAASLKAVISAINRRERR